MKCALIISLHSIRVSEKIDKKTLRDKITVLIIRLVATWPAWHLSCPTSARRCVIRATTLASTDRPALSRHSSHRMRSRRKRTDRRSLVFFRRSSGV